MHRLTWYRLPPCITLNELPVHPDTDDPPPTMPGQTLSDYYFVILNREGRSILVDFRPHDEMAKRYYLGIWHKLAQAVKGHHDLAGDSPAPEWVAWKPGEWCDQVIFPTTPRWSLLKSPDPRVSSTRFPALIVDRKHFFRGGSAGHFRPPNSSNRRLVRAGRFEVMSRVTDDFPLWDRLEICHDD